MTMEHYQEAWKQQRTAEASREASAIARRVARSHRWQRRLGTATILVSTATVALIAYGVLSGRVPRDGLAPLLACTGATLLPAAWLVRLRYLRWKRPLTEGADLASSLRWSLADTAGQIRELAMVLVATVVVILPSFVWVVDTLVETGRMDGRAAASFATLVAVIWTANILGWGGYYLGSLAPRRDRLEHLVALFDSRSSPGAAPMNSSR